LVLVFAAAGITCMAGRDANSPRYDRPMTETGPPESTATLLSLMRDGDGAARERLVARYLPLLRRWAHGRLPGYARDLNDTNDLVQITLMSALRNLEQFESRHEGALLAYLRTSLMNAIRQEIRRTTRHGGAHEPLPEDSVWPLDAELSKRLDTDRWLDYEQALARLSPEQREAVILRLEFGMGWAEIAAATERSSADAARMLVSRALVELARELK
jgi:RNA polymerase sigma factor (sigma-70 family)